MGLFRWALREDHLDIRVGTRDDVHGHELADLAGGLGPGIGRGLHGTDITALPTAARNIAQVFQFPVVYDTMSV